MTFKQRRFDMDQGRGRMACRFAHRRIGFAGRRCLRA